MCQLSCKPPEVLSVTRLQTLPSLPQTSKDVPVCLPPRSPHLPGYNRKLPDCRQAAPQGGEIGPSCGQVTEAAWSIACWEDAVSPGQRYGVPTLLLVREQIRNACIFE